MSLSITFSRVIRVAACAKPSRFQGWTASPGVGGPLWLLRSSAVDTRAASTGRLLCRCCYKIRCQSTPGSLASVVPSTHAEADLPACTAGLCAVDGGTPRCFAQRLHRSLPGVRRCQPRPAALISCLSHRHGCGVTVASTRYGGKQRHSGGNNRTQVTYCVRGRRTGVHTQGVGPQGPYCSLTF